MSFDSCRDDDDGLALTSHVPCTSTVDVPCVFSWMYIGCVIIKYSGCRCLVSLTVDVDTVGPRYEDCGYGRVTSSGYICYIIISITFMLHSDILYHY